MLHTLAVLLIVLVGALGRVVVAVAVVDVVLHIHTDVPSVLQMTSRALPVRAPCPQCALWSSFLVVAAAVVIVAVVVDDAADSV